jgi:hypothetical protein
VIGEESIVVLYLTNPREQYWGRLDSLTAVGVQLRGLVLNMVEEWARDIVNEHNSMGPSTVFFPMARVEKIFLDEDAGAAESVRAGFRRITGDDPLRHL